MLESEDQEYEEDDEKFAQMMDKMPCGEEWLSANFLSATDDAL